MSTTGFIPFVSVRLIDYSLKPRRQACFFLNVNVKCSATLPLMNVNEKCSLAAADTPKCLRCFMWSPLPRPGSLVVLGLFLVAQRGAGRVSHGLNSQLISLTIKTHCGLEEEEARAQCAGVAGV